MTLVKKMFPGFFVVALCAVFWSACSGGVEKGQMKYSVYVMMKDASEYLAAAGSFEQASFNPKYEGTKMDLRNLWSDLILKDGNYYRLDWKT